MPGRLTTATTTLMLNREFSESLHILSYDAVKGHFVVCAANIGILSHPTETSMCFLYILISISGSVPGIYPDKIYLCASFLFNNLLLHF